MQRSPFEEGRLCLTNKMLRYLSHSVWAPRRAYSEDVVAGFSPRSTPWKQTRAKARDYTAVTAQGE